MSQRPKRASTQAATTANAAKAARWEEEKATSDPPRPKLPKPRPKPLSEFSDAKLYDHFNYKSAPNLRKLCNKNKLPEDGIKEAYWCSV